MWHRSDVAVTQDGLPAVTMAPHAAPCRLPARGPWRTRSLTGRELSWLWVNVCVLTLVLWCHCSVISLLSLFPVWAGTAAHPIRILERFGSEPNKGDLIPVVSVKICRQQDIAVLLVTARKLSW